LLGKVITAVDILPQDNFLVYAFRNEPKQQEVTIVNNEPKPLTIKKIENPIKGVTTELKTVREGKEYKLVVNVDTATLGKTDGVINVHTDHPKFGVIPIRLNVWVRTVVGAIPNEVRFGNLKLDALKSAAGALAMRSVIVRNHKQGKDFKIEKVESDSPYFKVESEPVGAGPTIGGYRVKIQLDLEKVKPGDSLDSTVTIKTNDKETPELKIPIIGKIV